VLFRWQKCQRQTASAPPKTYCGTKHHIPRGNHHKPRYVQINNSDRTLDTILKGIPPVARQIGVRYAHNHHRLLLGNRIYTMKTNVSKGEKTARVIRATSTRCASTTQPKTFHYLCAFAVLLPGLLKTLYYRHILGWRIGKNVRIGLSYIVASDVTIGDNVQIGHFNIIKGLRHLHLGSGTFIGRWNRITAQRPHDLPFPCSFSTGPRCWIMTRHFIDACGTIELGENVSIAGHQSTVWSHSRHVGHVDHIKHLNVIIHDRAYIGGNSVLVGCDLPRRCVVGAGSVVSGKFEEEEFRLLIAGNPASIVKRYEIPVVEP
jgi:acetyltransferase-like isoleucine patch superfamily enzyme